MASYQGETVLHFSFFVSPFLRFAVSPSPSCLDPCLPYLHCFIDVDSRDEWRKSSRTDSSHSKEGIIMSLYDLHIKGGTVVDGSRAPRRQADVWIKDGKIAQVGGQAQGSANQTIDAD